VRATCRTFGNYPSTYTTAAECGPVLRSGLEAAWAEAWGMVIVV
jgi:hypothetical protein